jgi:hypothetical protein
MNPENISRDVGSSGCDGITKELSRDSLQEAIPLIGTIAGVSEASAIKSMSSLQL